MKRVVFIVLIVFLLIPRNVHAFEIPQIEGYDMFSEIAQQVSSGDLTINPIGIINNILMSLSYEVKTFSKTAAVILVMALLSSSVGILNTALGERALTNASFFTFFSVLSGLALNCFSQALGYATEVTECMVLFMNKLTPIIILTLFTCCKSVSAASFEPILSASVFVASEVITRCLIPMISFSAVLSIAGNIGDKNNISGFIKIIKSTTKWIMTGMITIFTGINAIYGFASPTLDALSAKTVKFAMGSLVPVVGGFLSDTLEAVISGATVLKNAVGVSGIIIMCGICITPIIKIGIMQLLIRLISAVIEPITDRRISGMLWDVSGAITALFSMVTLTSVLFIINISIIIRATG